jgi:hypothetical protein
VGNRRKNFAKNKWGLLPASTWIVATEVEHFAPGSTIEYDPDLKAYPNPISQAKPGTYQVMALLDPDDTYAYHGEDEGNLTSVWIWSRRGENGHPMKLFNIGYRTNSCKASISLAATSAGRSPKLTIGSNLSHNEVAIVR